MKDELNLSNKTQVTYTKEKLIKSIARTCKTDVPTVRKVYNTLENSVENILSTANSETDVSIRLFEGITLNSTFVPESRRVNNLTGETITTTNKIKPKANITRSYREKLTAHNN